MNENNPKNNKKIKILESIIVVIGIGLIQGCICGITGLLLAMINDYAIFGVVIIWLILGWFTTYIIKIRTREILTVIISGKVVFFLVLYISGIRVWFISMIIGISILFWGISLVTKLMLFTKITSDDSIKKN